MERRSIFNPLPSAAVAEDPIFDEAAYRVRDALVFGVKDRSRAGTVVCPCGAREPIGMVSARVGVDLPPLAFHAMVFHRSLIPQDWLDVIAGWPVSTDRKRARGGLAGRRSLV